LRNTHPNLWKTYLAYAVLSIALGANFWWLTPTFMPLEIPKEPVGLAFAGCGAVKLALLLANAPNRWLRRSMALSVFLYSSWAGASTYQFFDLSQTSMQLPIAYMGLAALGVGLLIEPFVNPATAKNGINSK
jgi:hypothetical protein